MIISLTKKRLIEILTAQHKKALAEDARAAKAHKADEEKALAKFKADMRKALGWDYKTTRKMSDKRGAMPEFDPPSCPMLKAPSFARTLSYIKMDMRGKDIYQIVPDSDLGKALDWEPASAKRKKTVCD